ncbi:MAG: hypothetical protein NTZ32_11205 [Planctomycetales bacterium]|nr:hypothetical protein [Planctomycetales bacterium]
MIRLHEPHRNDVLGTSSRRWPFPELQRLLKAEFVTRREVGIRRVLVAGDAGRELTTWWMTLGLEVVSFEETVCEPSTPLQSDPGFELVFAVDPNSPQSNLLDSSSRARTARLLSQLRPSGQLLVLSLREPRPSHSLSLVTDSDAASERSFPDGHDVACWVRHLACFPGKLQTMRVPPALPSRSVWRWMFGASVPSNDCNRDQLSSSIVSLRIPVEPVTAAAWQDHVQRGLLTGSACCELAQPTASHQRRAA